MVQDVSVGDCLAEGWAYYKRYILLSLATLVVYLVIAIVGGIIPILGFIFGLLITPILANGLYFYFLNVARDSNPRLEDIFAGFRRYGTLIGLHFLYLGVALIGMLPTIIYAFVAFARFFTSDFQPEDMGPGDIPWGLLGVAFLNSIVLMLFLARYFMTYFIVMDEPRMGLFDALHRSADITRFNTHNLILLAIASFFIMIGLFIALILPAFIIGPFLGVALARMYIKLKAMHEQPLAQPGFPPEAPPMTM